MVPAAHNGSDEVANSPYAHIFDLPVGSFGVVYFFYMFGFAALLAFDTFSAVCVSPRLRIPP